MIFLPLLTAFLLGFALLRLCLKQTPAPLALRVFLSMGLGLGAVSGLNFLIILAGNGVRPDVLRTVVPFITAATVLLAWRLHPPARPQLTLKQLWPWILLGLMIFPLWNQARGYPYGGWDAWQVWNFKAKFLLLSGDEWRRLFAPELWRSSPHYPLLLPLINVWGWLFTSGPVSWVPMGTAVLFTFLTAGLLMSALRLKLPAPLALLAVLFLVTWPSYALMSVSQYCDVVLGYYLLAALICIRQILNGVPAFAVPAGIFTGLLTFTKPEGAVAGLLLSGLTAGLWLLKQPRPNLRPLMLMAAGCAAGAAPTAAFHLFCSPGNQTFINGLTSAEHPATLERLGFILVYLGANLIQGKWHGAWIGLIAGLLLAGRRAWSRSLLLLPLFTGGYLGIVIAYYGVNTYFKIAWWMGVSLERILFSLLPVMILWVFAAHGGVGAKSLPSETHP